MRSVPKRRFKGFSEPWEQHKLGEVAEFNPKSTLPDKFQYVDLESVVGTELIAHRTEHKKSAPSRAQRLAVRGDVLYQTVRPYQKNNYLYDLPYSNFVFSTGYTQMRPDIDSYFLFSRIQEDGFVALVLDRCTGTSYPAISSNDLADIKIKVPKDKMEQIKVGAFFKTIDTTIAANRRKLDKLLAMKQAYLHEMFPAEGERVPKRRFAGFTDPWEQRELGDLGDVVTGNTPSTSEKDNWTDDGRGHVWITPADINWLIVSDSERRLSDAGWKKARTVPAKSVLITSIASIGKNAINIVPSAFNQQINAIVPSGNDAYFILSAMVKETQRFASLAGQTATAIINKTEFEKFTISLPILDEQIKIGKFFARIDCLIALEQRKLAKVQSLKQAFLHEMFV